MILKYPTISSRGEGRVPPVFIDGQMIESPVPLAPAAVLLDQPLSAVNQNAYVNQDFSDLTTYSSYLADDFTNPLPWSLEKIFIPGNGWNGFTTLMNATSLTWAVYADAGGVPAGWPGGGAAVGPADRDSRGTVCPPAPEPESGWSPHP